MGTKDDKTAAQPIVTPPKEEAPMDESSTDWMNDDVIQMSDSDEEDAKDDKPAAQPIQTSPKEEAPKVESKHAFAGLPLDESSSDWMNDDVIPMSDNDEEDTRDDKPAAQQIETPSKKEAPKVESKPAFVGL